jgi:hypothetical protein
MYVDDEYVILMFTVDGNVREHLVIIECDWSVRYRRSRLLYAYLLSDV